MIARSTLRLFLEAFSSRPRNSKHCCRLVVDGCVSARHVSSKEKKTLQLFSMRANGSFKTSCFSLSFRRFKWGLYNSNIFFGVYFLLSCFLCAHWQLFSLQAGISWHWSSGFGVAPLAVGWCANGWAISNVCPVSVIAFRTKSYWSLFQHFREAVVAENEACAWSTWLKWSIHRNQHCFQRPQWQAVPQFLKGRKTLCASDRRIQCSSIFAGCVLNNARP